MSGDQTHAYDLVWEWAEDAYEGLLSVFFDTNGFLLDQILGGLNIHLPGGTGFKVTVSFDKPAGLPAAATDVVDINVLLGDGGALGALRIVASVDVDSSAPAIDFVRINLEQKLWLTEISVVGFSIPGLNNLFANSLRNLKLIPLVPFPVDRTTTDNIVFKNADVRIIDDTSPADQDASALLSPSVAAVLAISRRSRRVSSRRCQLHNRGIDGVDLPNDQPIDQYGARVRRGHIHRLPPHADCAFRPRTRGRPDRADDHCGGRRFPAPGRQYLQVGLLLLGHRHRGREDLD